MIIVNPIQSFTEQDMSDDPIYPSPTVKGQKSTTPEHKGLICAPLATIKVGHRRLQKQEVFVLFFLNTTHFEGKDLPVPLSSVQSGRGQRQFVGLHLW